MVKIVADPPTTSNMPGGLDRWVTVTVGASRVCGEVLVTRTGGGLEAYGTSAAEAVEGAFLRDLYGLAEATGLDDASLIRGVLAAAEAE